MSTTTFADVSEGVRAALAVYTQALDDGRTDDVVATFCPEGDVAIPGMGTHTGHDALHQAYTKWAPRRPQRHLVLNTVVEILERRGGHRDQRRGLPPPGRSPAWEVKLVGRYNDVLHRDGATWRFHHRAASFVTEQQASKERP